MDCLFLFFFAFLNFILFTFLYSSFLLVIYFIHISVYMSIPISQLDCFLNNKVGGLPGDAVVKNLPANAGDTGLSPGLGRCHMPQSN